MSMASMETEKKYANLSDPELLQTIEDSVFAELEYSLYSDDYVVENVAAVYISQEYLDELAFNTQSNVFFGYTLAEIEAQFQGTRYIFTLGADNQTTVEPFELLEDHTYEQVIKNVAIGTGVILLCATVSIVATTVGAPATVTVIFATAADTATQFAVNGFLFGGLSAGIIKAIETGNYEEALKAGILAGSEGFKWGAISGAVIGGFSEGIYVNGSQRDWRASEKAALEQFGGEEQVSFLHGERVSSVTSGSTKPDILRTVGDHYEAIEVKNYSLDNEQCFSSLKNELYRQVKERIENMPTGTTQRIVLDVKRRNYSISFIEERITELKQYLSTLYYDIPIDYLLG